jgi:predicted phosphodiesterase
MGKLTRKGELAIEYLKKYPNKPILTIAKKLYADHPGMYTNIEHARRTLRQHAGSAGVKSRTSDNFQTQRPLNYNYMPFESIPKSYQEKREPYILPKTCNNILVLNDIHFPYHDPVALKAAIDWGVEQKVNCIYLNGDILDFYGLSDFIKDPSKPKMKEELEQGRWFLEELRKTFPNCPIYYKIGNHEMRFERWLKVKGFEFLAMDEFQLSILLQFAKYHVIEIDKYTTVHAGNLRIIHGHEYKTGGGVQPARLLYLKTKANVICGHFHRISSHVDRNIDGKFHGGWSVGCLCELSPDYMPNNDWAHGFARVTVYDNGDFTVDNKMIVDGKVI